jgi:hypothetical protein
MALALRVPRRFVTIGLVAVALIAAAFVAAALWNPWRYTVLFPLAQQGGAIGVLVLAGALAATAVLLTFRGTVRTAVTGLLASLIAIPALCVGLPVVALQSSFRRTEHTSVLAVSPDEGYSAVAYTITTPDGPRTRIYIRTRSGLFSREASTPLAECAVDPFARETVPEAVRFTSDTTIAVSVDDEPTTVVRFDPDSLEPERVIAICPDASG